MEIKVRKIVALILCICICVTSISADAKTKKVTGKDGKYITWNYDKDTKTLTFSGKGPISDFEMDGHGSEPEWYVWNEQTEHIVVEEGITSVIVEMDYIYITAGNTFEILDWLKGRSENFNAIKQAVLKGTNYIGVSAGAMIAGTDIELAYEFDKNFVTLKDLSGLGLYEGTIIPHYGKREFNRLKKSLGKKIDMYKNMFSISDKDCIVMEAERPFK